MADLLQFKVLDEMVLTIQDGIEAERSWIWFALSPKNIAGPGKRIRPLMGVLLWSQSN